MQFTGWMYDIAREQAPGEDFLQNLLQRSAEAGYTAAGLYLEHRFAYPSALWAAGPGALDGGTVRRLVKASPIRVIPFLNTLGHMEGFIRSEGGRWLAEAPGRGTLQICPSREECRAFAWDLVADAMEVFDDEWVHLGGDETTQLGACPACAERVKAIGKGGLYAEYYGELCRRTLARGRRPGLWGDMLLQYPEALDKLPRETIIFDWHYGGPPTGLSLFREKGFDVVSCPAFRTYDASWCFLEDTQKVIDAHAQAADEGGALGVLACAWEFFGFSAFGSIFPLILATGRRLAKKEDWETALEKAGGSAYRQAAEILGNRIPASAPFIAPGSWRTLRDFLALRGNPFFLWLEWREEACGPAGDDVLRACDEALGMIDSQGPLLFPLSLHRAGVEWVRKVEAAYLRYAEGDTDGTLDALAAGEEILRRLRPGLERTAGEGGSVADLARHDRLMAIIGYIREKVLSLAGKTAWRPGFETLIQDCYLPGDQAAWRSSL
ncbi:MAG: family 20 glycosylhydrolase [bacterium]|nr:family 20 glycosylhydrolase [bacterium]